MISKERNPHRIAAPYSYLASSVDFHCCASQCEKKKDNNISNFQDILLGVSQVLTQN